MLKWGKSQGGVVGFSHSGWGLKIVGRRAPDVRGPAVRRHRRQRVHRRRGPRRGRLHLDGRHAGPLGAQHLVSHAQLRLSGPGSAARPTSPASTASASAWAESTSSSPTASSTSTAGARGSRRAGPTSATAGATWSTFGSTTSRVGEAGSELKLDAPGDGQGDGAGRRLSRARADRRSPRDSRPAARRKSRTGTSSAPGSARRARCPSRSSSTASRSRKTRSRPTAASRDVSFDVPIEKSSWVALRIYPSSHTNPVFVLGRRQADPGLEEVGRVVPEGGRPVLVAEGAGDPGLRKRRRQEGVRRRPRRLQEDQSRIRNRLTPNKAASRIFAASLQCFAAVRIVPRPRPAPRSIAGRQQPSESLAPSGSGHAPSARDAQPGKRQ